MRFGQRSLRHFLTLALLLCAADSAGWAQKQQFPILELRAQGSKLFSDEDILRATGLKVDAKEEVSLAKVREAAEKLVGSGVFTEVNYQHAALRNGMKVEFTVKDKPAEQSVPTKLGNFVWWPENQLVSELHSRLPLYSGRLPLGGSLADEVGAELESMLKARQVKGHVSTEPHSSNGTVDFIGFEIEDWPVRIAAVSIPGASETFAADLKKASSQLVGAKYQPAFLDSFADNNLKDFYLKKGYLQARFSPPHSLGFSDKEKETLVELEIPVSEGIAYKLGPVRWSGNQAISSEQLQGVVRSQTFQTIDGVEFARDIVRLREDYASRGYLHMAAQVSPRYDEAAQMVNYDISIKEGDLFTMGKINIEGLPAASAMKATQTWKLREGDPFDAIYLRSFFKKFTLPEGASFKVEETEGEAPHSVDVTILVCAKNVACRPSAPNQLFSPTADSNPNPLK